MLPQVPRELFVDGGVAPAESQNEKTPTPQFRTLALWFILTVMPNRSVVNSVRRESNVQRNA